LFVVDRLIGRDLGNKYGAGTGRIWLDDLGCTGSETYIGYCSHRGWGSHNCDHSEDVSIACYRSMTNNGLFAIQLPQHHRKFYKARYYFKM